MDVVKLTRKTSFGWLGGEKEEIRVQSEGSNASENIKKKGSSGGKRENMYLLKRKKE